MYRAANRDFDLKQKVYLPIGVGMPAAHSAQRNLNVLIVDDEPADALLVERTLAKIAGLKFNTTQATTLRGARDAIKHASFDLALVDYDLDGECGVDLVSRIRNSGSECATVVVSGYLTPTTRDAAWRAGAAASIAKNRLGPGLAQVVILQALECCRISSELRSREAIIRRLKDCKLNLSGDLPSRLEGAMQDLLDLVTRFGHQIDSKTADRNIAEEASELRHLAEDFEVFSRDTMLMFASLAEASPTPARTDFQSVVLDALRLVDDLRRHRGVTVRVGLADAPVLVVAQDTMLRLAVADLLGIALTRCMPGSQLRVDMRLSRQGVIELLVSCDDVILRNRRVTLQNGYLLSRCLALLGTCGARLEMSASGDTRPSLGALRFPSSPGKAA